MPRKSDRSKKKKFRRMSSGKAKRVFVKGKTAKHHCSLCERQLHGVPHSKTAAQVRKLSKTKRRPTGLFAGVLCGKCRNLVAEEAAKIAAGVKKINQVELRLQKYVEQVKVC